MNFPPDIALPHGCRFDEDTDRVTLTLPWQEARLPVRAGYITILVGLTIVPIALTQMTVSSGSPGLNWIWLTLGCSGAVVHYIFMGGLGRTVVSVTQDQVSISERPLPRGATIIIDANQIQQLEISSYPSSTNPVFSHRSWQDVLIDFWFLDPWRSRFWFLTKKGESIPVLNSNRFETLQCLEFVLREQLSIKPPPEPENDDGFDEEEDEWL